MTKADIQRMIFLMVLALVAGTMLFSAAQAQNSIDDIVDGKLSAQEARLDGRREAMEASLLNMLAAQGEDLQSLQEKDREQDKFVAEMLTLQAGIDDSQNEWLSELTARLDALENAEPQPEPQPEPDPLPPVEVDAYLCAPPDDSLLFVGSDPAQETDMMAMLRLVQRQDATACAWASGNWSDTRIWSTGQVPVEGDRVWIPESVSVLYGHNSVEALKWLRVDGTLAWRTDIDTLITVETCVSTKGSHVTIGTVDDPVDPAVEAIIAHPHIGPINVAEDPQKIGLGCVTHGDIEVHGAKKSPRTKVENVRAGATELIARGDISGWRVGDGIALAATERMSEALEFHPGARKQFKTQSEERVIVSIDGNRLTINAPLEFDHVGVSDYRPDLVNLTRNVKFVGLGGDDIPVQERPHNMNMAADKIDIRYAEFRGLGRTDKSVRSVNHRKVAAVKPETNIQSRYGGVHIHRYGFPALDSPAIVVGNVVVGTPSFAYVHHDSHADFINNTAYDFFGSGFFEETGNGTGRWVGNIAIKSNGTPGIQPDNNPKGGSNDLANFDVGRTPGCFWFQGRAVDAVDNICADVPKGQGYIYMNRAVEENMGGAILEVRTDFTHYPESLRYAETVNIHEPAIVNFIGNEAYAVETALFVVKPGPAQFHDVRSVFSDLSGWNVKWGANISYTGHYTFIDNEFICSGDDAKAGYVTGQNTVDIVWNRINIDGCPTGFQMEKTSNMGVTDFEYVFIDVDIDGADTDYANLDATDLIIEADDLTPGRLTFASAMPQFTPMDFSGGRFIEFPGVKTDSIDDYDVMSVDTHRFDGAAMTNAVKQEGYWTRSDGAVVSVLERHFADRATGALIKYPSFFLLPRGLRTLNPPDRGGLTNNGVLRDNNTPPVAVNDNAVVAANGRVVIDVVANDNDLDGDALQIDGINAYPRNGRARANADGTVTYVPDPDFVGEDSFSYWLEDNQGGYAVGDVKVSVN